VTGGNTLNFIARSRLEAICIENHTKPHMIPHVSTCWEAFSIEQHTTHYQNLILGGSYPGFDVETTPNFSIFTARNTPNCIMCACIEATRIQHRAKPDMLGSNFNRKIKKQLPKCNLGWFLPLIRCRHHPKCYFHK
jgi:hypothetical protein